MYGEFAGESEKDACTREQVGAVSPAPGLALLGLDRASEARAFSSYNDNVHHADTDTDTLDSLPISTPSAAEARTARARMRRLPGLPVTFHERRRPDGCLSRHARLWRRHASESFEAVDRSRLHTAPLLPFRPVPSFSIIASIPSSRETCQLQAPAGRSCQSSEATDCKAVWSPTLLERPPTDTGLPKRTG